MYLLKIMRRGIISLILDPIIFILILKYINQRSAYLYICVKFLLMFTAYGIGLFRQFLYSCKVNIENISVILCKLKMVSCFTTPSFGTGCISWTKNSINDNKRAFKDVR